MISLFYLFLNRGQKMLIKYFEINKNSHNIRCKIYANDVKNIDKVIVFCHGFADDKDNKAAEKFANRVLSKNKDFAVLIFNWPAHGDDVKKKVELSICMEYLEIVLGYIKNQFKTDNIYSCATSFGGYLVLRYISLYGNPFKKVALRCPAVNMRDILTDIIMSDDDLSKIKKGKNIPVGFDTKVVIDNKFLEDLREANVQEMNFIDYADDIIIVHGTDDEVVPFDVVNRFAEKNIINFVSVKGSDHRFLNPKHMEVALKSFVEFFEIK